MDAMIALGNVLKSRPSADRLPMRDAFESLDRIKRDLAARLAKL